VAGFIIFGRLATFALRNEAESGSLVLRLAGSPREASPGGLLRRSLAWLPVERATIRVTSFQVTRTTRLRLAHQRRKVAKDKTLETITPESPEIRNLTISEV
jgi:hypothetical protein